MSGHSKVSVLICFAVALMLSAVTNARAQDDERRAQAVLTKIFLSQYKAIPIFRLNPLSVGDVVQVDNETVYVGHGTCYPTLKARPLGINAFDTGESVTIEAGMKVAGELLSKKVAQLDASVSGKTKSVMTLTIKPLSETVAPDVVGLRRVANDPQCQVIPAVLDGAVGRYAVAYGVLYGRIRYALTTQVSGGISASVSGELVKTISKSLGISDVDITISGDTVSFVVSTSPGDLPLAVVPAVYSVEEMARITYFMRLPLKGVSQC